MSERAVRELLEEATRDIPAGVARPPLSEIRRRAMRRRFVWPISISGALGAVVAAAALAVATPGSGPAPVLPPPSFAWSHAYAADGGQTLTIDVFRPSRCATLRDPRATVTESDDAVAVTITGDLVQQPDCPPTTGVSPRVTVRLDRPLGERALRDGAREEARPVFREELVPVVPEELGWRRVPDSTVFFDGDPASWYASFTKPGGPDVWIMGRETASPWAQRPAIGTIRLGTRDRNLHPAGATYQLSWDDGPIRYVLVVQPSEDRAVTEDEFREVVGMLRWP